MVVEMVASNEAYTTCFLAERCSNRACTEQSGDTTPLLYAVSVTLNENPLQISR